MSYLDIALQGSDGKTTKLRDFIGQRVILYFYPKDNTSGCTLQAKDFTSSVDAFHEKGYTIIGVSRDGLKSHKNFIEKQNLNLLLLSDGDLELIKAFDVLREKQMYGKSYIGVDRSTFVLDEKGDIIKAYRGVTAKNHVELLLTELGA